MKTFYKMILLGVLTLSISTFVSADEDAYWAEMLGWEQSKAVVEYSEPATTPVVPKDSFDSYYQAWF